MEDADLRINATTRIWKFATMMLALCIPLVGGAAVHNNMVAVIFAILVPLAVIGAAALGTAALGTAAVWGALGQRQLSAPPSGDLKQLEERMANLEIIHRYENALQAQKDINSQLRAEQKPEPTSYEQEPRKLSIL